MLPASGAEGSTNKLPFLEQPHAMDTSSTVRGLVWYGGVLCLWAFVVGVLLLVVLGSGLRSLAARGVYPPCWWLVSNLSAVQLALATFVVPLNLATESIGAWPFDGQLCRAWLLIRVLLIAESSWTVFAVTLDRFFRHVTPLSYARCVRCRTLTFFAVAGTWGVAGVVAGVTARSLTEEGEAEGPAVVLEEFCATSLSFDHSLFITLTSFAVPSILVLVLLLAVAMAACSSRCASTTPVANEATPSATLRGQSGLIYAAADDDAGPAWTSGTYSTASVGICFVLGWAPFFTVNILIHICQGLVCVDPAVWTLFVWVGYSTAGLMPLCWFLDPWVRGQAYRLLQQLHRHQSTAAAAVSCSRRRKKSGNESVSSASDSSVSKKCSEVSFL